MKLFDRVNDRLANERNLCRKVEALDGREFASNDVAKVGMGDAADEAYDLTPEGLLDREYERDSQPCVPQLLAADENKVFREPRAEPDNQKVSCRAYESSEATGGNLLDRGGQSGNVHVVQSGRNCVEHDDLGNACPSHYPLLFTSDADPRKGGHGVSPRASCE